MHVQALRGSNLLDCPFILCDMCLYSHISSNLYSCVTFVKTAYRGDVYGLHVICH